MALPGGFGTCEEFFEVLTWGQLGIHDKPISLLNVADFFDPLLYAASNSRAWTLSVSLSNYSDVHRGVLWNLEMAASLIFMIPVIILFFLAQRVFVEGVTLTGVKG